MNGNNGNGYFDLQRQIWDLQNMINKLEEEIRQLKLELCLNQK